MDQIVSTFGINTKLLLIQAVNFGILLFLLNRFLYRPLLRLMEERQAKIEQGILDAKQAASDRTSAETEREEMIVRAKSEAKEIVDKALAASEKMRDSVIREAEQKSQEIISNAEKTAQNETFRVVEEAKKEVAGIALAAVEKILREKVGEREEEEFIKKTIHG